jgi:hypothetical protein
LFFAKPLTKEQEGRELVAPFGRHREASGDVFSLSNHRLLIDWRGIVTGKLRGPTMTTTLETPLALLSRYKRMKSANFFSYPGGVMIPKRQPEYKDTPSWRADSTANGQVSKWNAVLGKISIKPIRFCPRSLTVSPEEALC